MLIISLILSEYYLADAISVPNNRSPTLEQHQIEGVDVQVYSVAKTIADCFKFRNQIGLGIAIEALKEAHKEQRFTAQEIYDAGQITRTNTIMRPYLEAIL